MTADVVVVGGGLAGLSAATRLAEAGRRVLVIEEAPRLGGRASVFTDRDSGERVDNGQHVIFGCYHQTYAYLKRIGTAHLAPLQSRMSLAMARPDGRLSQLTCPVIPPPWHLIAGVLRWSALSIADRFSALHLRTLLERVRRDGAAAVAARVPKDETVAGWLTRHRQSPTICEWLWRPLAVAALNQSADRAAAAPFVRVLGELFGPRVEDSAVALPKVPLDELCSEPAERFIRARGGDVWTTTTARVLVDADQRLRGVSTSRGEIHADTVISAVPWFAFDRLWAAGVPSSLAAIGAGARAMAPSPIVTVNLWFDGPVMTTPFVGFVKGPMHWAFDKSAIFGERAGHLSVVSSGAEEMAAMDNATATRVALDQLHLSLPATRTRALRRSVIVREHRATFSLEPGQPQRPSTLTPIEGFLLAGDWTDTGLPATIEGAVRSGHAAADIVVGAQPPQVVT